VTIQGTTWGLIDDGECRRVTGVLELVGRKWNSGILLAMARGADRFSQIRALVGGLSDRLLAARLKELEQEGLVDRLVEATTPVTVRYQLTSRGHDLMASLQPMIQFGERWRIGQQSR
jgi:DNA-binding HxlR family transcriptional regulator